jgi:hypothetical protein
MFRKSALTNALNAWLADGGALTDRLPYSSDSQVCTRGEGKLVCAAIDQARASMERSGDNRSEFDLRRAISLMQNVRGAEARDALIRHGLPRLRAIVRERLATPGNTGGPVLFALKIIGLYQQPDDVDLFLSAVRAPLEPDSYLWTPAFHAFTFESPYAQAVISGLANPLPGGFIRVVYLDCCNSLALNGRLADHPFASEDGVSQLEQWLTSGDREKASYAVSACTALPFLPGSARERLLDLANRHSDAWVRIEAAWACAKSGIGGGAGSLVEFARDPRHSKLAISYLEEVGLAGQIPAEARAPDFVAIAEMCNWIAHPSEYGRPPDEIVQVDTRQLYWPPTGDRRQLWVFRYRYDKDDGEVNEGQGMVGSVTWAMFSSNTTDLSPEDIYGLHCAWELIQKEDPAAPPEADVSAGRAILAKRNPGFGRASSLQMVDSTLPGEPR